METKSLQSLCQAVNSSQESEEEVSHLGDSSPFLPSHDPSLPICLPPRESVSSHHRSPPWGRFESLIKQLLPGKSPPSLCFGEGEARSWPF